MLYLPSMAKNYQGEIVREARHIARLQLKRRQLRAEMKRVEAELRAAKKIMAQLVAAKDVPWDERGPSSKIFGIKAGT